MRRSELEYSLPPELIAQQPIEPRDSARLLVAPRGGDALDHGFVRDLPAYLRPGDCLVLNDTRVVPARFFARRAGGARIEGLFVREEGDAWVALMKGVGRLRPGERLTLRSRDDDADVGEIEFVARTSRGTCRLRPVPPANAQAWLARAGHAPLPPYIRGGRADLSDAERYQTVYANAPGAVAAPTAGLHFTRELLQACTARGVSAVTLTLHVGPGTFAPVEVDDLSDHEMHGEWFAIPAATLTRLAAARRDGGRIVCVGTTAARALESLAFTLPELPQRSVQEAERGAWTHLLIQPPYDFRNVDGLLTNFHLPASTLLALVMALAGVERIRAAYEAAIRERYRFYSYGDAMLLL